MDVPILVHLNLPSLNLLSFVLVSYGLTQILVYGKILDPIRPTKGKFGELFKCPMCTGFWVGVFLWFVKDYTQLFTFDNSFITAFLLGCASSASAFLGSMLMSDEGINLNHNINIEGNE